VQLRYYIENRPGLSHIFLCLLYGSRDRIDELASQAAGATIEWSILELDAAGTAISADLAPRIVPTTITPVRMQLYIPPGSFKPTTAYRFLVAVSMPWSRGVVRVPASVDITTTSCPTGGSIKGRPASGTAGITE
jgi:hypothetical protein